MLISYMSDSSILLWWLFCGLIGGAIGATKGRAGAGILWGALLGPIGIIISLCLTNQKTLDKKTQKKCPNCAERIQKAAKICRYCRTSVIQLECPNCDTLLYKPDAPPGTTVKCGACSCLIKVID
jgi:hypothetical protein